MSKEELEEVKQCKLELKIVEDELIEDITRNYPALHELCLDYEKKIKEIEESISQEVERIYEDL
jgi:hypothetical protein